MENFYFTRVHRIISKLYTGQIPNCLVGTEMKFNL